MSTRRSKEVHDQEEEKMAPPRKDSQPHPSDFLFSQESIKQIEEAADHEVVEERQRLLHLDKQKKEFANQLKAQQEQEFKQKQNQTQSDRLKFLLKQSEIFSHFILQNNKKDGVGQKDQEEQKKVDKRQEMVQKNISKRHSKRTKLIEEEIEEQSEEVVTRLQSQPSILQGGQLKDYQLDGLNWLILLYERGINGILADEMGLGKTIQTISLLAFLREFKHVQRYFLIIVPKSTIPNWMNECKKWCPQIKVVNLIARKEQREEIIKNQLQPDKFDVCITTFEGCRICLPTLNKFKWEYIIVDEAHKIKNEESQLSQKLRILNSRYRLLLTGTPLQNNLHELWSLLNFLLPDVFSSSEDFDEWFDLGGGKNAEKMSDFEKEQRNMEIVDQLHKILRPFMLRRIKKEVEKNLPPKVEIHINVGITEQQKLIYRQLLKKSTIEKGTSVSFYKNIIIQLRKICDHPYLFEGQEPQGAEEFGEHIITSCGKMIFLDKLLKKLTTERNQVLIFSGFTSLLDILEDFCLFRQYKYCRLDGNTELEEREKHIEDFTKPDSDKFIFLISTRAGGLGLNLMTANIVILYDSDWNPQIDLQAMDRAHRIGQTKVVQVFRLITKNTMEEKLIEKQAMKLKLDSLIIQKGRLAPKHTGFQKDELQDMVNYGADAIFEVGSDFNEADIDALISDGREKANEIQRKAESLMKDKMNMIDFSMNSMNMYQFEDVDYLQEKRKEQAQSLQKHIVNMLQEEVSRGRREKKVAALNLNESKLFPKFFQGGNIGISSETKKKKLLKVQDYRFFPNSERLKELLEKEMTARYQSFVADKEMIVFSEEEKREKDYLWQQGFTNWDRRDYQRFCQALELYPKDDFEAFSNHIQTKSKEEVETYAKTFFEKMDTLQDFDKIKKNIEKAEKMLSFKQKAPEMIKTKVMAYENPVDEMQIYATQKSKYFSKESDIILLCLTHKFGYGNWREIKKAVRRDSRSRFDHLFLSRNEGEIARRVDILVKALEKECTQSAQKKGEFDLEENKNFNFDEILVRSDNEESNQYFIKKFKQLSDVSFLTNFAQDEMEDVASSKSPSLRKPKKEVIRKQSGSSKREEEDEEEKFKHLKAESELRIGGRFLQLEESPNKEGSNDTITESMNQSDHEGQAQVSSDKKKEPPKKRGRSKLLKDTKNLKQSTLNFDSKPVANSVEFVGKKRKEHEKEEYAEGKDEEKEDLEESSKEHFKQQK